MKKSIAICVLCLVSVFAAGPFSYRYITTFSGRPEGVVDAEKGQLLLDELDGEAWIKTTRLGLKTGWRKLSTGNDSNVSVSDSAYDAVAWNGSTNVPTQNSIRDLIETLTSLIPLDSNWNAEGSTNSVLPGIAKPWAVEATDHLSVTATNGSAGFIDIGSTNNTYTYSVTVESDGTFVVNHAGTNVFKVALDSANDDSTNLFLAADGVYRAPPNGEGGAVTIPPAAGCTNIAGITAPDFSWRFEDIATTGFEPRLDSVAGLALELSGAGNAPSVSGLIYSGASASGGVVLISGGSGYPTNLAYTAGNDISISFWVYPENNLGSYTELFTADFYFHTNAAPTDYSYYLTIEGQQIDGANAYIEASVVDTTDFSSSDLVSTNAYNLDGWNHYVLVYSAGTGLLTVYVNGAPVGTSAGPGESMTSAAYGRLNLELGDTSQTVRFDELELWLSHALTTNEIALIYNEGYGSTYTGAGYVYCSASGSNWEAEGDTNSVLAGIAKPWALEATDHVSVTSTNGSAGFIDIGSTNNTYTYSVTVESDGTFVVNHAGTNVFKVALDSANDDSTNLFLAADGVYRAVSAGTTINSTDRYLPYRSNATTFANSPFYRLRADALGWNTTDYVFVLNSTNYLIGALTYPTGGGHNTGFGLSALSGLTTGTQNAAFGAGALESAGAGLQNAAFGQFAGRLFSSYNSTFVGYSAGSLATSGSSLTLIGERAGFSLTTGSQFTAVGTEAGYYNLADDATVLGHQAGGTATNLNKSVVIGSQAQAGGERFDRDLTSSVWIGYKSASLTNNVKTVTKTILIGEGLIPANNNEIIIGSGATGHGANTATIGDASVTALYVGNTLLSGGGLAATDIDTSAELQAILTDETGSGAAVFANSPTLVTPTIASMANANHNHQNAAGGGTLDGAAITSGTVAAARLGAHNLLSTQHGDTASASVVRGDLLVGNSTPAWSRLARGNVGQTLTLWPNTDNTVDVTWRKAPYLTEFAGGAPGEWLTFTVNAGSASGAATVPDSSDFGVQTVSTGTATNGAAGFRLNTASLLIGSGSVGVHWRIKTPTALSTDADVYALYVGVADTTSDADPVDGAYFYYTHGSSTAWQGKTANNSVYTTATGGGSVTVVADTWYDLFETVTSGTVNFWVSNDNAATWTFIGSCSANIPTAAGRETGVKAHIRKLAGSTGTTARIMYLGRCAIWPQ